MVASSSAALALPSGWRCCGVGRHGPAAVAGGGGISGEIGIERVDVAHAVSGATQNATSVSLSIACHRVFRVDDEWLASGQRGGICLDGGDSLAGEARFIGGPYFLAIGDRHRPGRALIGQRLKMVSAEVVEARSPQAERQDDQRWPEPAQKDQPIHRTGLAGFDTALPPDGGGGRGCPPPLH